MSFNGTEGGAISLSDGAAMTANFRRQNPNQIIARFFGREILEQLLDQENCMGIRMYYGLDADNQNQLILVGADQDENDILELVADISHPCPLACSASNPLNS